MLASVFSDSGISKHELCDILSISESTAEKKLRQTESAGYLTKVRHGQTLYYSLNTDSLK